MIRLHRIVFTGGPGGGKTEATKYVCRELRARGIPAYIIPEPATHIAHPAGFNLDLSNQPEAARVAIQRALFRVHLSMTREIERAARALHPDARDIFILCDRWFLDGKAYDEPLVSHILAEEKWPDARIHRACKLVIVMQSPAVDAPELYQRETNEARIETDSDYVANLDARTRRAWENHPECHIIGNVYPNGIRYSFEDKLKRVWIRISCYCHLNKIS